MTPLNCDKGIIHTAQEHFKNCGPVQVSTDLWKVQSGEYTIFCSVEGKKMIEDGLNEALRNYLKKYDQVNGSYTDSEQK